MRAHDRDQGRSIAAALVSGLLLVLPALGFAADVGADCAACHDVLVPEFTKSPHGRAFAMHPDYAGSDCASCHGSGQAHIDAGGDVTLIRNPAKLPAEEAGAACLACHENHRAQALWHGSAHEEAGLSCAKCHAVHGKKPDKLLDVRTAGTAAGSFATTEVCLSCHTGHRRALFQRSAHPLREGAMDCTSCHNPHGANGEHLIDADSVNDLCFSCHQEVRGPFLWEHSPVREDCLTCHTPHGSNHDKLLVGRPVQLCQSCHLQGRHQTVAGLQTAMWNTNRQCLNCHSQIHGSNHPSGPLFQR